ncbi:hypothetical protein Tco_1029342 [Tanacetum coccineum]|uniref:Uncharacterized protein n=1 Tax=Tanacetum coccineum TaxID=301880 RepID=A0ABQ5G3D6_9ASTR
MQRSRPACKGAARHAKEPPAGLRLTSQITFNIWMAFGGNTLDLGINWRRNGQDYESTPRSLKEFCIVAGDGVVIPHDAVISYKQQREGLYEDVRT